MTKSIKFSTETPKTGFTRRDFIQSVTFATALLPLGLTGIPVSAAVNMDDWIIINGLGGVDNPNPEARKKAEARRAAGDLYSLDEQGLKDALASGLTATNLTLRYNFGDEDPFESTIQSISQWNATIDRYPDKLKKVWKAEDIRRSHKEGKIGIIYGFQNAVMVGNKPERIDVFANLGVRIIQLTYNPQNQLGSGSMVPVDTGLTDLGKEVIEHLHANKVILDLSHSGHQTCLDATRAAKRPITISHTGCKVLADLPRNKTDKELRLVADTGGVVGIYFMPFLRTDIQPLADDVVRHIEHAINICGEDHVGIGTDGGITQIDDVELYRKNHRKQYEQRVKLGIASTGEKPNNMPFIEDLRGPGQFRKLADLLSARGHNTSRIEKILGSNNLRLMQEIWG